MSTNDAVIPFKKWANSINKYGKELEEGGDDDYDD